MGVYICHAACHSGIYLIIEVQQQLAEGGEL